MARMSDFTVSACPCSPAPPSYEGFMCLPSTCPRVRGLTRGFTPASLTGIQHQNVTRHQARFTILTGTDNFARTSWAQVSIDSK